MKQLVPILATMLIATWSGAALASSSVSSPERGSVAILNFNTVTDAKLEERSEALTALIATQLSANTSLLVVANDQVTATLTVELQRELLGSVEAHDTTILADELGVRYVVFGRMDQFGDTLVVTAAAHDTKSAQIVRRWRKDITNTNALPTVAGDLGDEVAQAIANHFQGVDLDRPPGANSQFVPQWHINVDLGKTVPQISDIEFSNLSIAVDLETGWYFSPNILGFIEVGISSGKAEHETATVTEDQSESGSFKLIPAALGCKYLFTPDDEWRPYVGFGVGVELISGFFQDKEGDAEDTKQWLPNVEGRFGVGYFPFERVGFDLETNLNLNSGIDVDGQEKPMVTFNASLGVVVLF